MAISRAQKFAQKYKFYLKCDINKFFENVDHLVLKNLLKRIIKNHDLLHLLDAIIDHKIPSGVTGKGIPIGNLSS